MSKLTSFILNNLEEKKHDIIFYAKNVDDEWTPYLGYQVLRDVKKVVANLLEKKITRDSRVCSFVHASYKMVVLDIASYCIGCTLIPLLPFQVSSEIEYIAQQAQPDLMICDGNEASDKLDGAVFDKIMCKLSELFVETDPADLHVIQKSIDEDQDALITFTSGTTSAIKGCVCSHAALYSQITNFIETTGDVFQPCSRVLMFQLPGGIWFHVLIFQCLYSNCVFFLGNIDHYLDDLASSKPNILPTYAGLLEKIYQLSVCDAVDNSMATSNLTKLLGGHCRAVFAAASPSNTNTSMFYNESIINYYDIYASTETIVISLSDNNSDKMDSVGKPIKNTQVRLGENNEILIKTPSIFTRYLNAPDKTKSAFIDGWYKTGDIGTIDEDGYLSILGRLKTVYLSALGFSIYPEFLEKKINECPEIYQSCIFGDGQPYLVALIAIHPSLLKHASLDAVQNKIDSYILNINESLNDISKIKYHKIIKHCFSEEKGEVSPYQKIMRKVISHHYYDLIQSMY